MNRTTRRRPHRLAVALALALGLTLVPTAAGAVGAKATPRPTPPPPVGADDLAVPLPDLTLEAFDATEADGEITGRLTLSAPLTVDLPVTVTPRLLGIDEWDLAGAGPLDADIPAGATQVDVEVSVWDDDGPEPAEAFGFEATVLDAGLVDVGPPAEAVLYDGDGLDLAFADTQPEAPEGDPGSDGTLDLVVEADQAVPHPVTFRVSTAVVGKSAVAGVDHEPVDVVVELPAGETTATVTVPLVGDQQAEADELFFGNLGDLSHGEVALSGSPAVARILDDDGPAVTWTRPGGYQSPSRSARSAAFTA